MPGWMAWNCWTKTCKSRRFESHKSLLNSTTFYLIFKLYLDSNPTCRLQNSASRDSFWSTMADNPDISYQILYPIMCAYNLISQSIALSPILINLFILGAPSIPQLFPSSMWTCSALPLRGPVPASMPSLALGQHWYLISGWLHFRVISQKPTCPSDQAFLGPCVF